MDILHPPLLPCRRRIGRSNADLIRTQAGNPLRGRVQQPVMRWFWIYSEEGFQRGRGVEVGELARRSTRKCPDINKSKFVVFDCFDGTLIRYFQNTSDFEIEPPGKTPLTLPQIIENIWQNVDRDYHVRILAKRLRRIEKDMSSDARLEFAAFDFLGRELAFVKSRIAFIHSSPPPIDVPAFQSAVSTRR